MKCPRFRFKQSALIAASVAMVFAEGVACANPTGPQVVNGAVSLARPNGSTLNVTNSPGAIINWQGFSIGASEITRFIQQSPSSAVLNRVVGGNISQIHGQLLSNGRVFLINPSGIVVGPGAVIDTAGFVGSTLNMLDADFLAGKLRFQGDAASGSIVNQGWIRTSYGGQVILVAPQIENSGLIHTPGGELILAAGKSLTISSLDMEGVHFEVQAPGDSVLNIGKLLADGGAVGVFAGTLRHSGDIRANALIYDEAGRVVLKGQNELQLAAGSTTSADGRIGGSIIAQSPSGTTNVAGIVSAQGSAGAGGSIALLGNSVAVVENAIVNASGSTGGGTILVGGDYQGANPAIQNATKTGVGSAAILRADASESGDGGRIVVWSDDRTQFYGSLSAQGGALGGNGGFAEVSGKQHLIYSGNANLGAPKGALGTLLLDPLDVYIFAGGGLDGTIVDPNFIPELFPSNAATVSPTTLASTVGNVVLHASRYMRFNDDVTLTTPGQSLTATVGTYVPPALPDPLALNSPVASPDQLGPVTISNMMEIGANITTAGGAVSLSAPRIQSFNSPTITTAGGAISLNTTGATINAFGLSLSAGTGAVTAASSSSIGLDAVAGSSFNATASSFISTGNIATTGPVSLVSSGSSINTSDVASGGGTVSMNAAFSVNTGAITGGGGAVSLSGSSVSTNIDTTGSVQLAASAGNVFATVDNASSLTATSTGGFGQGVFINSSTNLNINSISADCGGFTCPSTVSLSTSAGSILATSAASLITGGDVTLTTGQLTSANGMEGGRIGTAALPLNVDAKRNFNFSPNNDFRVVLAGAGPNRLNMQLGVAAAGDTWGQTTAGSVTGTGINLSASADATTVTGSLAIDGNVTSRFNQLVFGFQDPTIMLRVPNGSLVATSVIVPEGDTTPPVVGNPTETLNVSVSASNNLTLTSYTRQSTANSLPKLTEVFSDNGTVIIGTITGSKDAVDVNPSDSNAGNVTVGNLATAGNVTVNSDTGNVTVNQINTAGGTGTVSITADAGAILAQVNAPGAEITAGGQISLTAATIGTSGFGNPLDLVAPAIMLARPASSFTAGAFGFGSPVNAVTSDLTINAVSMSFDTPVGGSTFNVNTGAVALNKLAVTADPAFVGAGGLAQVQTGGGSKTYSFVSNGTDFTFNPGAIPGTQFAGGSLSFTSTQGNIALGNINLGTGSLAITAREGSITGNPLLDGAALSLTAGVDNNVSGVAVSIETGNIGATVRPGTLIITSGNGGFGTSRIGSVTTGSIEANSATVQSTAAALTVGNVGAGTPGTDIELNAASGNVVAGSLNASSSIQVNGNAVTVGTVSGTAGTIDLKANSGLLTLGGTVTGGAGSTITLLSTDGVNPLDFTTINAGAGGTVNVTSSNSMRQTGGSGITAETVFLGAANEISKTVADFLLDIHGTSNLTIDSMGQALIDANGSTLSSLLIRRYTTPDTAPFTLANLGSSQTVTFGPSTPDLEVNSPSTPLNFTMDYNDTTTLNLAGGGVVTGGGSVRMSFQGGFDGTTGGINTGGGNVELSLSGGSATLGAISSGGGNIGVNPASLVGSPACSTPPCDITIGGAINAGAGSVELRTASGNITSTGSAISSTTSVLASTGNGEITALTPSPSPLLITSPTVILQAGRGLSATGNEGFVRAQLTDTTDLTLDGDLGFNVSSTNTGFNTLSVTTRGTQAGALLLTAPGQTFSFSRPVLDAFSNSISNTFRVISSIGPSTATFRASDGDLLIGGTGTSITVSNLTLLSSSTGDIKLQGTSADPLVLSGATQVFGDVSSTRDLLIGGNVTLTATGSQTLSANSDINVQATQGAISITAADQTIQTGNDGGGNTSTIQFLGGAAAGESVVVTATNSQTFNAFGSSTAVDSLKLMGGAGSGASVTVLHSGSGFQLVQVGGGAVTVAGGGGPNAFAELKTTGTNQQKLCRDAPFLFCGSPIGALNILGGSNTGAFAQVTSAGPQFANVSGLTTVMGGTGDGAHALLQSGTGATQTISTGSLLVEGVGGIGVIGKAEILATGFQDINSGSITVTGGPNAGSLARIATTGTQDISASSLTMTAGGVDPSTSANASAIIEGHSQFISSGTMTLNGGAGIAGGTSDALIRNLSGSQFISANSITLNGGHTHSTTGILNLGTGTQSVSGSFGITLNADPLSTPAHADSFVLIQNQAATQQTITANGGGVTLTNTGDGTVAVASAGTQAISAHFVDVTTSAGGSGSSTISSTGNQRIHASNETGALFFGMRVAASGTGTASIESGASQLLEVTYPQVMQSTGLTGALFVGDVNVAGTSRIKAVDQSVFAGSITVQSGDINSLSELKAASTQTISTLTGGISVLGGSGDDSLAQIDPTTQTILSNGTINIVGGDGTNAIAQIVSGSAQTIYATSGNLTLSGGFGPNADALITNVGPAAIVGTTGNISLTAGSALGADAFITVGAGAGSLSLVAGGTTTITPNLPTSNAALVAASVGTGPSLPTGVPPAPVSSSPVSAAQAAASDATQAVLDLQEDQGDILHTAEPESDDEGAVAPQRAPICS